MCKQVPPPEIVTIATAVYNVSHASAASPLSKPAPGKDMDHSMHIRYPLSVYDVHTIIFNLT